MGIHTDNAERKWQEGQQDDLIKLKCLELVLQYGLPTETATPWNKAQRLFTWVKWGNPDMVEK